jgi:putative nucleotidyltransferase with HDIG domain
MTQGTDGWQPWYSWAGYQENFVDLLESLSPKVSHLSALMTRKDPQTAIHQQRVAQLSASIALKMRLPAEQVAGVWLAGILHDIGKIAVPGHILTKPCTLTTTETSEMQAHALSGYKILGMMDFPRRVRQTVLQHHERMDGSGYPSCIKGKDLLLESRILAVADVVDAMRSHRPYRAALTLSQTLEEIVDRSGVLYDSQVVDIVVDLSFVVYGSIPLPLLGSGKIGKRTRPPIRQMRAAGRSNTFS